MSLSRCHWKRIMQCTNTGIWECSSKIGLQASQMVNTEFVEIRQNKAIEPILKMTASDPFCFSASFQSTRTMRIVEKQQDITNEFATAFLYEGRKQEKEIAARTKQHASFADHAPRQWCLFGWPCCNWWSPQRCQYRCNHRSKHSCWGALLIVCGFGAWLS